MHIGWALPLAFAAMAGVVLGGWMPPGMFEIWALITLLTARRLHSLLVLLVLAWTASSILLADGAELVDGLSRQDVRLQGRILASDTKRDVTRLRVAVEQCQPLSSRLPACDNLEQVRLSLYDDLDIQVGDDWALTVRLRPPSGFANPQTFDYRGWLWREGIGATGYVRSEPSARRMAEAPATLRRLALSYLDERALDDRTRRWLAALTLGAGERLTADDWSLLNGSGTTHLVVISGLHVGLVAAGTLWLLRGVALWLSPRRWRMAVWPWWGAGVAAAGYAWLAGLDSPAMRAMIMTLVGLWVASGRHAPGTWQAWWLALGLVVISDPLSVWRPGLWLSFLAVGLLILIWQGRARPRGVGGWLSALVRTQLLLAPLMAAAALWAFHRLAPAAPFINLLAVPWVSSVLVPLGMSGWLVAWSPALAELCWSAFALARQCLHDALSIGIALLPVWTPPDWLVVPLILSLASLSIWWAIPGLPLPLRCLASVVFCVLPVTLDAPSPAAGELWMRVMDVGQGLAVELRTQHHHALYDLGPRFRSGFMPLEGMWPAGRQFDRVIVSHGDMDHAGGLEALEVHEVASWVSPASEAPDDSFAPCQQGDIWRWDGVTFRILWPPPGEQPALSSNDRSCVLLIETSRQRVLLPGDADRSVERRLLASLEGPLDVLVAGHHGSRTSSGSRFVTATMPGHVIFSSARDNAFGHPDDDVVRRFRRQASCLWNTASDGAVTLELGRTTSQVTAERPPVGVGSRCHQVESLRNRGSTVDRSHQQ